MKMFIKFLLFPYILFITGCGTTGKFVYPDQMRTLTKISSVPLLNKTVAIMPFDDYRGNENSCLFPLYLIPLMPLSWANYERPDATSVFLSIAKYEISPQEDLAKATAVSLRTSNIFKDAFFTMGGEKNTADYILTGKINMLKYNGKMFSYGLSIYCPFLWLIGAPAGLSENRLAVDLQLKDKQGRIVWIWSMDKEESIVQWIYVRMGYDCKMFSKMYQEGMNDAMNSLAERIRARTDLFQ